MTCWRRLRDWQQAVIWKRLHRALLDRLGQANAIGTAWHSSSWGGGRCISGLLLRTAHR